MEIKSNRQVMVTTAGMPQHSKQSMINHSLSIVYPVSVELADASRFDGSWYASQCHENVLMRLQIAGDTASRATRTAAHLALESDAYFVLFHVREGTMELEQHRQRVTISRNQFLLLSAEEPYEMVCPSGGLDMNSARLPRWLLASRLRDSNRYVRRPYELKGGVESITMDFIAMLMHEMPKAVPGMISPLTAQLADLVALTFTARGSIGPDH